MTVTLKSALGAVPADIADALGREYGDLESRYSRADWAPASLNGGRFAEALIRYLQWKQNGTFTAVGAQLEREKTLNRVKSDASVDASLRLHVSKCAELLLDVRNHRDVAHLGRDVDVKEMDSHLVLRLAAWSLSEVIRQEAAVSASDRQQLVDRLSAKTVPLVEEIGGELVVLSTSLDAGDRSLVVLYHAHPEPVGIDQLRKSAAYTNSSRFRSSVLGSLQRDRLIHLRGIDVHITRLGIARAESVIQLTLNV